MRFSPLSTLHRALVAFSALQLGRGPRAAVLAAYEVTEADLHRYSADWQRLQALRAAEQTPPWRGPQPGGPGSGVA